MDTTKFAEAVSEASITAADNLAGSMTPDVEVVTTPTMGSFSAEDLTKVREQEKAKLYPQLERLKDEVASLRREKEEREQEEARMRAEAEAEAKRRAEEEMDVRSLLQQKEIEWTQQLEAERLERERAIAMLDMERQYQELQQYRVSRIEAERDNIMPELIDLVGGNTPEEIESSIQSLKDRTTRILDSAQQAMTSARRDMVGSRVTMPAAGPLDTDSEHRPFSPEDISQMSMSDYQKYRERLLGSAAASRGRGLFG